MVGEEREIRRREKTRLKKQLKKISHKGRVFQLKGSPNDFLKE